MLSPYSDIATSRALTVNRIAIWALCVFVFAVPIGDNIVVPGAGSMASLAGYLACALCLWSIFLSGHIHKLDSVHMLCVAFVAFASLSLVWTYDSEATSKMLPVYVQLLGMMWLIDEVTRESSDQRMLLVSLVAGTAISAAATFYAYKTGNVYQDTVDRYTAEGFDPNQLALTFALAIPAAWYLSLNLRRFALRMFFRSCIILLFGGILLTGSRGGFMAGLTSLLIVPALSRKRSIGTTALFLAGTIAAVLTLVPAKSWDRIFTIRDEVLTGTMTGRTIIWTAGIKQFYKTPVLGVGAFAFPKAVGHRGLTGIPHGAHNTYLSILVELGVIGFAIFASILLVLCKRIRSLPKPERRLWGISLLTWCIGSCSLGFETAKMTWLLFAMIVSHAAIYRRVSLQSYYVTDSEMLSDEEYEDIIGVEKAIEAVGGK